MEPRFDFVVVGAGPAGLQAALALGRARRRVLLCDSGEPRNAVTGVMHGFLSRDGIDPAELRRVAAEELRRYPTVELRTVGVETALPVDGGFGVTLAGGVEEAASKLILATGVVDELPLIAGLEELWGRATCHCAYCDAFERSDKRIAVVEAGANAGFYAMRLGHWSADVVLCTNGPAELPEEDRARLSARDIAVRAEAIARLEADGDGVRIVFTDGPSLARQVIFIRPTHAPAQRSRRSARLQRARGRLDRGQRLRPDDRRGRLRGRRHGPVPDDAVRRRRGHHRRECRRHRRRGG
jgi:thioredoxin reductase